MGIKKTQIKDEICKDIHKLFKKDIKWLEWFSDVTEATVIAFNEFKEWLESWKNFKEDIEIYNESMGNLLNIIKDIRIAILIELIIRPGDDINQTKKFAKDHYEKY